MVRTEVELHIGRDIRTTLNIEYAFVKKIIQTWDHNKETTWSAQKTVAKGHRNSDKNRRDIWEAKTKMEKYR